MATNPQTVAEHADLVEQLHGTGQAFSMTWHAGDTAEQRMALIDTWHATADELRRRGWTVEVGVDRSERDTESFAIRIAPGLTAHLCGAGSDQRRGVRGFEEVESPWNTKC